MDYNSIKSLALSYADREDIDVINRMDDFLRVTESRINRYLDVGEMFNRAVMVTQDDQEYYGLPSDFSTLRDIEIHSGADTNSRITPAYYSPEQFNTAKSMTSGSGPMYTIIANQIQISPVCTGDYIEIVYAQKIPELNEKNAINWISESAPDLYVFGLFLILVP